MEINITEFFNGADPSEFSASKMERGEHAGRETWNAAKIEGEDSPLLKTPAEIKALRRYVEEFGAWDDKEIAAWSNIECNALFVQLISGDIRETGMYAGDSWDWEEYERGAEAGHWRGNLFRADDGDVFYSLSN